jgi:dephospho-CoA kinase
MKVIGLTGGIGSGKSTVALVFQSLGIPVFNADNEALALYSEDRDLLREVVEEFGKEVLNSDGTLNRKALSAIVFENPAALKKLNSLIHPLVAARFSKWRSEQHVPIGLREAAILFESGSHVDCDSVIVVTAPEQLRVERVMRRSGISEADVRARIARQWPEEKLRQLADWEIVNDDNCLVLPQVLKIAEALRS